MSSDNQSYDDQISLGELIKLLEKRGPELPVRFDFPGMSPTRLESWRGVYADLALGYAPTDYRNEPTVATLLTKLRAAIGAKFEGWKGGLSTMHEDTPLWVDNPGEYTGTAITGLADDDESVVRIATRYRP